MYQPTSISMKQGYNRPFSSARLCLAILLTAVGCKSTELPRVFYQPLTLTSDVSIYNPGRAGALSNFTGAAVDKDGSLYLVEWELRHIVVVDSAGNFLRLIGSAGDAPGQFALPGSIGFVGDTLWVADPRLRRITLFQRDGEVVRMIDDEGRSADVLAPSMTLAGLLPDGSLLKATDPGILEAGAQPPREIRYIAVNGDKSDTLFSVTAPATYSVNFGSQLRFTQQPFDASPFVGVSRDGSWWVRVERAHNGGDATVAHITAVSRESGVIWESDVALNAERIPPEMVDSIVESVTPDREQQNGLRDWLDVPPHLPLVANVSVCDDGCVWLQESSRMPNVRWVRVNSSGEPDGAISLPASATILSASSSRIWVVERDMDGVPKLTRYSVVG